MFFESWSTPRGAGRRASGGRPPYPPGGMCEVWGGYPSLGYRFRYPLPALGQRGFHPGPRQGVTPPPQQSKRNNIASTAGSVHSKSGGLTQAADATSQIEKHRRATGTEARSAKVVAHLCSLYSHYRTLRAMCQEQEYMIRYIKHHPSDKVRSSGTLGTSGAVRTPPVQH